MDERSHTVSTPPRVKIVKIPTLQPYCMQSAIFNKNYQQSSGKKKKIANHHHKKKKKTNKTNTEINNNNKTLQPLFKVNV